MKNLVTHVATTAVVLVIGVTAGNSYHHQQVVNREKAAKVAAQKAEKEAQLRAQAAVKAAQVRAAALAAQAQKVKANVVTPKSTNSTSTH